MVNTRKRWTTFSESNPKNSFENERKTCQILQHKSNYSHFSSKEPDLYRDPWLIRICMNTLIGCRESERYFLRELVSIRLESFRKKEYWLKLIVTNVPRYYLANAINWQIPRSWETMLLIFWSIVFRIDKKLTFKSANYFGKVWLFKDWSAFVGKKFRKKVDKFFLWLLFFSSLSFLLRIFLSLGMEFKNRIL